MKVSTLSISVTAGMALLLSAHAMTIQRPVQRALNHTNLGNSGASGRRSLQQTRLAAADPPPPTASAAGPNTTDSPAPPAMTGSGAPYLLEAAKIMAALQTADIQVAIHTLAHPTNGKPVETDGTLEIAWEPEKKFHTSADGVAGKSIIVGTGASLYIYNGKANEYLKKGDYPVEAGQELVRNQLAVLLGPGAPTWIYQGVHDIDHHKCDEITTQDYNPGQTIYLDRTTHLPRRVIVTGNGPGGSGTQDTMFLKFQSEGPLPDSLFQFTPPRGAKAVVPDKP